MAEKVESGASVHLSHDPLGSGVDAFGATVVIGQGYGTVHCGPVDLETGLLHGLVTPELACRDGELGGCRCAQALPPGVSRRCREGRP